MTLSLPEIHFRPLDGNDADIFSVWLSDPEVTRFSLSSFQFPQSKVDISQWLNTINGSKSNVSFGITLGETGALIGYAGIASISSLNRCGEYFIMIGSKEHWGRGIGSQVTKKVVEYGFETLGLHRIELTAFANNPGAIKAYENAGFQHEGVKRESGFRQGKFFDKVQMGIIVHDWLTLKES
ncbi:GNAT family N-acetyltransferase [Veronia nyctiphanis]|uniref:GNAT family N-acetyltransferase n=1 Tax=Veronia nyctiphanis TaxID=1278244 RepID=A0A4Q0YXV1_9GAMM|nr:GNAT family protein [Veronia nyctiphanis]RXJ74029.1 GNAT family N-acetyltransferase [Veronia nyctiphanis]